MSILTRYERWALLLLSISLLASALVLIFSSGPSSVCWTPAEFTQEMSRYANQICSTKHAQFHEASEEEIPTSSMTKTSFTMSTLAPVEWLQGLPKRLFTSTMLLLAPLVIADILTRVFNVTGANEDKLSTTSVILRALSELVCRATFIVFVGLALNVMKMEPSKLESTLSPRLIVCGYSVHMIGRVMKYSIQCVFTPGQQLMIATSMIYFVKLILGVVVGWAIIGFVQSLIFILFPTTRQSVLRTNSQKIKTHINESKMQEQEELNSL